ncbi:MULTISPECIES: NAD-dependent epimerase/dehydratase family protein [unclassified Pseudomonas]|uniref:NAD-dependent epimerase/dehydratase family protein n=1 Tax=unclassified Pseudomonas TaxID=196821 RepID=UPI001DEFF389|nr:NAD-dependent epimerase/dehydratase family protein [Pseudomonas sp.]MPT00088.1 NAD-dependent epimerase/dehydratase family protein [Pseudomonas sp.]
MILVSGASGFIGKALCAKLEKDHFVVRGIGRDQNCPPGLNEYVRCDLEKQLELDGVCEGVDTIIHLAGRAHILNDTAEDPVAAFRSANVDVSIRLAQAAIRQGVRRFIFISSIGVNASETLADTKITEDSPCSPTQLYGVSKKEAESALSSLVGPSNMELVIIRPPLVYAGNAPGNFHRLMSIISKGVPLPFKNVQNLRSMVSLENLIDFICLCVEHPSAANEVFLVSDGVSFSTGEIIRLLAQGMGKKPKLFAFPTGLLEFGLAAVKKKSIYSQLCGSLVVDSSKSRRLLGWVPPVEPNQALLSAGAFFKAKVKEKKEGR